MLFFQKILKLPILPKASTMPQRYRAFTLAEVLIVLGIIGIVAEMTIPTLMKSTQNAEYKAGLKKAYSVLSQMQLMLASDSSGVFSDALSGCGDSDHTCFKNVLKTKLRYIKECDGGANLGVCFPNGLKYLNGTAENDEWGANATAAGLVLADGMSFLIYAESSSCAVATGVSAPTKRCGWVTVDVNGLKKPNQWGKDIYHFWISPDSIVPASTVTHSIADDCNVGTNQGHLCASKYIMGN